MSRLTIIALSLLLSMMFSGIGCGVGHGSNLTTPPLGDLSSQNSQQNGSARNQSTWGLWQVNIDTTSGLIEAIPLRTANFTANVNQLLEGKPGNLVIGNLDLTQYMTDGIIDCTVTLKHPFPGLYQYDGFDVWGVFINNGATNLGYGGLKYSGGPNAGGDEGVLLNPDGYTRWFNEPEFDGTGPAIMKFWPGKLANLQWPTATLNAYKAFADGLGTDDSYYDWIVSGTNAADRGIFKAGSSNTRRYNMKFPMLGGIPILSFQYAVVATWEPGDPALTGNPSTYEPGDFPSSANVEEPFLLTSSTIQSDLWIDGSTGAGGSFKAAVEIFDWQGGSVGLKGVPNEINKLIVIGNFIPSGSYEFSQSQLASVAYPSTVNSSVFQVEIPNCAPLATGMTDFWMVVEAGGTNGASYNQGFPVPYPTGAARASFQRGTVDVSAAPPWPDVVYVDDDNTSGIEDGTHQNPWNTIMEGVNDPNALTKEIWVDDSGGIYAENVLMKDNIILRSANWDISDGGNHAKIQGPTGTNIHTVEFNVVNGATLQGFQIMPFNFAASFATMNIVLVTNGSNNTIKDCLFQGTIPDSATTYALRVICINTVGSSNLTIQNCRFDGMEKNLNVLSMRYWYAVQGSASPGYKFINNIVTNILSTSDAQMKNTYINYLDNCSDLTIKNNLVHNLKPQAPGNSNFMYGFYVINCTNPTLANNTLDSLDVTVGFMIQQVFAYWVENCTGTTYMNNMATSVYCNGWPPPLARGLTAINSTFTAYYCDMWDIGPGSMGGNYYFSGGVLTIDPSCISLDPMYVDKATEKYDLQTTSPAQKGDPSFVDWDDTGAPSGDPANPDMNTRSRMGAYGGPGGQYVGLLMP
jgi:hypothetical protein